MKLDKNESILASFTLLGLAGRVCVGDTLERGNETKGRERKASSAQK